MSGGNVAYLWQSVLCAAGGEHSDRDWFFPPPTPVPSLPSCNLLPSAHSAHSLSLVVHWARIFLWISPPPLSTHRGEAAICPKPCVKLNPFPSSSNFGRLCFTIPVRRTPCSRHCYPSFQTSSERPTAPASNSKLCSGVNHMGATEILRSNRTRISC